MPEKIKIGSYETICLLINMILYKTILTYPRNVAEDAGAGAWIMVVLVSAVVFVVFLFQTKLYKNFPGQDILKVGENALGEVGRIIIGILLLANFLVIVPVVLREFAEDIKIISLTSTPISFIILLFIIGMIIGAYLGLESLARIHAIAIPLLAVAFLVILALNIPRFDSSRLAPWLGLGPIVILKKSVSHLTDFSEIIVLSLVMPFLERKNEYGRIARYGILICSFFLLVGTVSYLLSYPYPIVSEFFLPLYQLARSIQFGRFFTRIEAAFILIWASSAFLFLSSSLYFIVNIYQRTFGLKYYKPLILPFTVLIFSLSLIPENLYSTLQLQMEVYQRFGWMITLLMPLIILGIACIRKKAVKNKET